MSTTEKGDLKSIKNLLSYIRDNDLSEEIIKSFGGQERREKTPNVVNILMNGSTLLMGAAGNGHINICEYLLNEEKANVDVQQSQWPKMTALVIATQREHFMIVRMCVEKNADISLKDYRGNDATHVAAMTNNIPIMELLLDKKPSLLNGKGDWGRTQLMLAAINNKQQMCEYLLNVKNADVHGKDDYQRTALHYACMNNNYEIANLLIAKGPKNEKDSFWGKTPLEKALESNNQKLKDLMQSHFGKDTCVIS